MSEAQEIKARYDVVGCLDRLEERQLKKILELADRVHFQD
jgi:hypothetical protein